MSKTWITAGGEEMKITDMKTSHIRNCLKMMLQGRNVGLNDHSKMKYVLLNELKRRNK